ncbi:MAG: NlpC/P60 family protein [Candidatus Pacebacteria bacterium]|nr:NlpC/P60 family protein [Candidatus Paceibacterota bacterium]
MTRKIIFLLFVVIFIPNALFGQIKPTSIEFRVLNVDREFSCENVGPCFVKDVEIYDKSSRKKINYYEGSDFDLSNLWEMDIIIQSQKANLVYVETNNIAKFIRESLYFLDCRGFVELVKNFTFILKKQEAVPFSQDQISVGDVLYMSKGENAHFAIYLGNNIYLSKYGSIYDKIFVTTFEQITSVYENYDLYIIKSQELL